jgi:hypothetical protein
MDGWLTIGTKLSTDKFDKQVNELENKIKKEEEKSELKLKAKLQAERELEQHKQDILSIEKEYEKLAQKIEHVQDIMDRQGKGLSLTPQDFTDMQNYPQLNTQYEKIGSQLDKMYSKQDQLNMKVARTNMAYQETNDKVAQYKQKIDSINLQKQQAEVSSFKDNFNGIGNSIQSVISKVTKLALGVFGIRTALSFVRRASSDLANYNPQYAANLEYIRYALTQMIAPVLEYILNLAKTILAYINYIANAWFGVNLFANASAKSFNKVKKNIGGASKKAKELQKTLAGFDEMNILNSNSTGGGGGVAGAIGPDFDLSDLNAVEIPDWIKWIANNKETVIGAIIGIASAFLIFKTLKITGILGAVGKAITGMTENLTFFRKTILALGIVAIITGIVITIKSLIDFIKDPSWNNFRGILLGLTAIAGGLAVALMAVNSASPVKWISLAVAGVTALITVVGDLITHYDEQARTEKMLKESTDKLREARNKLKDATDDYINAVDNAEEAERKLQEAQDNTGISIDDLLRKMDDEKLTYKDLNKEQREVYKAYVNNKNAQDNLKVSTENLKNSENEQKDKLYEMVMAYKITSSSAEEYRDKIVKAYNDGELSAEDAAQAISIALGNMDNVTREKFTQNIPDAIEQGLNPNNYQSAMNSFSNWWNKNMEQLKQRAQGITGGISNALYQAYSKINSSGFSTGGYVTKMASGGIINMPNRGVPLANAIGGEAGREGIIPLTDAQAMSTLGMEIGKNVVLNATIPVYVGNRVVARETRRILAESDFALNR